MKLIKLSYSKDKVLVYSPYSKSFIENIRRVNGATFQRSTKTWVIPFSEFLKHKNMMFRNYIIDIKDEDMEEAIKLDKIRKGKSNNIIFNKQLKRFEIYFKYNSEIIRKIRTFADWDKDNKVWYSHIKMLNEVERFLKNSNFNREYDYLKVKKLFESYSKEELLLKASKATDSDIVINGLNPAFELMGFQKAGVKYVANAKSGVLIADEMGLGKTIQGIASVVYKKSFPVVVIPPASLKINWKKEFEKWAPNYSVNVIGQKKSSHRFDSDVVVINYDIVGKFIEELIDANFKAMIIDESHYLKNIEAKRTKYVSILSKHIDLKILLSGTPILNRPIEIMSQLEIMGVLDDLFGGQEAFIERYCNPRLIKIGKKRMWDYKGSSNLKELNSILRSNCYIRREKKHVLKDLPEKTVYKVYLDLDNKAKKEYEKAITDLGQWAAEQLIKNPEFIELLNKKFPPNSDYNIVDKEKFIKKAMLSKKFAINSNEALTRVSALRQISAEGKLESVKEWVKNVLDSNEKLVLFGVHKKYLKELFTEFEQYNPVMITGDVSDVERDAAVESFQFDESCRLFLGTIKAAGVGLTLTRANQMAAFEFEWRPGDMDQMEARIDRYGQTRLTNVYYLMTPYGIDLEMEKMLNDKRKVVNEGVIGNDEDNYINVNELVANVIEDDSFKNIIDKLEKNRDITR